MKISTERKAYFGLLLAFITGVGTSIAGTIFKILKNIPPAQLFAYRMLGGALLMLPHLVWNRHHILGPPGSRIKVLLTACAGSTSLFLQFVSFRYMPLGEATAMTSSALPFVTIAARIFLKEYFGIIQILSISTTIIGVVLTSGLCEETSELSKPYSTEYIYGLAAALTSIIFTTINLIFLRHIRHVHHSVLVFNFGWTTVLGAGIITAFTGNYGLTTEGLQQFLVISLGFVTYIIMTTMISAMHYAEAGPVAVMKFSSHIFASFLWQEFLFGDFSSGLKILGSVLICLSIALLGFSKKINDFLPKRFQELC